MNNIPSDDDFAKASRYMEECSRNLDKVRDNVLNHFMGVCPLYDFDIKHQIDVDFRAYVFFEKDRDIEICNDNGTVQSIIDFVYKELERAGRGRRDDITVAFELDSDENVQAKYDGDYFLRLR